MSAAARATDPHLCPTHEGGPILTPSDGRVRTNSRPQARATDRADCHGAPDFIVTGSGSVAINSKPAARMADKTMHRGAVMLGSVDVAIGGPAVGVTLGNPEAGKRACAAAATGREPPPGAVYPADHPSAGKQISGHKTQQSYNNCGLEACRIVINQATGKKITEDELLDWAIDHKSANGSKELGKRFDSGGTIAEQRQIILRGHGVEATEEPQTMATITQAVAEGKGVITGHSAKILWDNERADGRHAILITGVTYDANGNVVSVTTLDTGSGNCAKAVAAERFERSLNSSPSVALITAKPIW